MLPSCYVAAPYPLRAEAQAARHRLAAAGIDCTARWIWQEDSAQLSHEWAQADLDDVRRADVLVVLNPVEWSHAGSGGRHTETGYALALSKPIYLVGVRSNIFHYHHAVTVCDSIETVVTLLVTS